MDAALIAAISFLCTAVILPLVAVCWKLRTDLTTAQIKLAVAETKLELYGIDAPELATMVLDLSDRMDTEFGEVPPKPIARQRPRQAVWPMNQPARRPRSLATRRERT